VVATISTSSGIRKLNQKCKVYLLIGGCH